MMYTIRTFKELTEAAAMWGLELDSYKPGQRRLYRFVRRIPPLMSVEPLSGFMTFREAARWLEGYAAARLHVSLEAINQRPTYEALN